jgi:hypothetical protein
MTVSCGKHLSARTSVKIYRPVPKHLSRSYAILILRKILPSIDTLHTQPLHYPLLAIPPFRNSGSRDKLANPKTPMTSSPHLLNPPYSPLEVSSSAHYRKLLRLLTMPSNSQTMLSRPNTIHIVLHLAYICGVTSEVAPPKGVREEDLSEQRAARSKPSN